MVGCRALHDSHATRCRDAGSLMSPGSLMSHVSIYLSIRLDVRRGGGLARALVAAALGLVVRNPLDLLAHLARVEGEG